MVRDLSDLAGKKIKKAEKSLYGERIVIRFTDGTSVVFRPGQNQIHNDFWQTVEYE